MIIIIMHVSSQDPHVARSLSSVRQKTGKELPLEQNNLGDDDSVGGNMWRRFEVFQSNKRYVPATITLSDAGAKCMYEAIQQSVVM